MAIDFYIPFSCPIQDKIGHEEIPQLSKSRDLLEQMELNHEAILANAKVDSIDEVEIIMRHPYREDSTVRIGELREYWEMYAEIGKSCCQNCPVNFRSRIVGCYGAINYPLSETFERWIAQNFKPPIGIPNIAYQIIDENDLAADEQDEKRGIDENGQGLIESLHSLPLPSPSDKEGRSYTTSQLMAFLMRMDEYPTELMWSLLRCFHAVDGDTSVIAELDRLILCVGYEFSVQEQEQKVLLFDLHNWVMTGEDGSVTFGTSESPYPLSLEENQGKLGELMKQLKFNYGVTGEDDRVTIGIKRLLISFMAALQNSCRVLADG